MLVDELFWRRAVVAAGAIIYWTGVFVQGRRIRRRIGRSPNLKPRGARERWLWVGWTLVVLLWLAQPFLVNGRPDTLGSHLFPAAWQPPGFWMGLVLTVAGYAGTLWCYAALGSAWRIGINQKEKNPLITAGPYRWIRHPIYAFQAVMLAGAGLLLPTPWSAAQLLLHLALVRLKSNDEEAYLQTVHGDAYRELMARTGRLFPKLW